MLSISRAADLPEGVFCSHFVPVTWFNCWHFMFGSGSGTAPVPGTVQAFLFRNFTPDKNIAVKICRYPGMIAGVLIPDQAGPGRYRRLGCRQNQNQLIMKSVLFVRVSKDQQDYQRQINDLTDYARTMGIQVVDTIAEKISGAKKNDHRPGVQALLQGAKNKSFQAVLVTELSRLGRSAVELQKLIDELTTFKVCVIIQNLGIRSIDENGKRSPMADLMLAIVGQFAQMERSTHIERVNSGLDRARRAGTKLGRKEGTKKDSKELLQDYAPVVKKIREGLPVRSIAKLCDCSINTVQKVKKVLQGN